MILRAAFVASLDMRSMLVLVLYDSAGRKMVNASLSVACAIVTRFLTGAVVCSG